jgi:hypothetical protein
MTLEEFVERGFADHSTDAEGVFRRLPEGLPLADTPRRAFLLANLATHVAGEHLQRFDEGLAFLGRIEALPAFDAAAPEGKGVRRLGATLHLCAGRKDESERLLALAQPGGAIPAASTRIRVLATASSARSYQGRTEEAGALLDEALALAAYGPGKEDPASRDLAVTGHNMACALEEKKGRTEAETAFMLRAAAMSRKYWEIAGDATSVERAEYRLAMSHIAAGMFREALGHGRECLAVIAANGADPGEEFFGRWTVARALAGLGDGAAARAERDAAAALLPRIEDPEFRALAGKELAVLDQSLTTR